MKLTKFVIPMIMTALLLGQNLKAAEEITLPVITKPAILDEGTQRVLSPDQIAELLPWAKDSKLFLTDALNDLDMTIISKKGAAPFKDFGVEYFNFLTNLNNSIFDASAQYNIQRTALEFLQWDLYRDLNNKSFAPQIVKINNNLKFFPVRKMRDTESIALIRQMKKVTVGMELGIRKEERSTENTDSSPVGSTSTET